LEKFVRGEVVIVPFPFTDLTQAKRRPALILAVLDGQDAILCQITSQAVKDRYAVSLEDGDFEKGGLRVPSCIRPNRIFTADRNIILYSAGRLRSRKLSQTVQHLIEIITGPAQAAA